VFFAAEHEGGLHIVNLASGVVRELKVGLSNVSDLTYSRKLGLLAFVGSKGHHSPGAIYLLNARTKKQERLYSDPLVKDSLYRPSFDPGGEFLYALNYSTGIFKYSLKARRWQPVPIDGATDFNPQGLAFSASGGHAAISPRDFKGLLIAKVEADGFRSVRTVLSDFDSCSSPQWINDDVIVFAGRKSAGLQFIWKFHLKTGDLVQLTKSPVGTRDFLALSPDKKSVVFTATSANAETDWRLWLLAFDGTAARQLTKGGELSGHLFPVWTD